MTINLYSAVLGGGFRRLPSRARSSLSGWGSCLNFKRANKWSVFSAPENTYSTLLAETSEYPIRASLFEERVSEIERSRHPSGEAGKLIEIKALPGVSYLLTTCRNRPGVHPSSAAEDSRCLRPRAVLVLQWLFEKLRAGHSTNPPGGSWTYPAS